MDFEEIRSHVLKHWDKIEWRKNQVSGKEYDGIDGGRYHKGEHGTLWAIIDSLPVRFIEKIEESIGAKIFRNMLYLWDFGSVKTLPLHIDSRELNNGKSVAGLVPLEGKFKIQFNTNLEDEVPAAYTIYKPGEVLLLNNLNYYHGGEVQEGRKLTLHFFLDTEDEVGPDTDLKTFLT